jgi:hypothetical protein
MEQNSVPVAAIVDVAQALPVPPSTAKVPPEDKPALTITPPAVTAVVNGKFVHIFPPPSTDTLVAPEKEKLTVTNRPTLV